MTYNYPFFSFPHFRRYTNYYPVQYPYVNNQNMSSVIQPSYSSNLNFTRKNNINSLKDLSISNTGQKSKNSYGPNNVNSNFNSNAKFNEDTTKNVKKERVSFKKAPSGFSFLNNIFHQEDRSDDEEYFDLFGLKLYNDDILLIGLIFFLYKEDVKDQYLFFALILLLLS